MAKTTLRVRRYNPEVSPEASYRDYEVELRDDATVLDALFAIKAQHDDSLSFRYSCRSAICGSCATRINGKVTLACMTQLTRVVRDSQPITVEPIGSLPVIRDLIVDFQAFWDKIHAVRPWLEPDPLMPTPEKEYIVPREAQRPVDRANNCIMCAACVSDCTVLQVDQAFLGPAALAKAQRFVGDIRDSYRQLRLFALSEYGGIWDCTRCMLCVELCPKDVAPMDQIMVLRGQAMEAGLTENNGARHSLAFEDIIKHSGWTDEVMLPLRSVGFNPLEVVSLAPVGIRMKLKKGYPPGVGFHGAIPGAKKVKRIFEKVEKKK